MRNPASPTLRSRFLQMRLVMSHLVYSMRVGKRSYHIYTRALKPINQLRMMEDSLVIYRLARAPERRIFYIDVGNMPRGKANEYMKDIMQSIATNLSMMHLPVRSKTTVNTCLCWKTSGCHVKKVVEVLRSQHCQGDNLGQIDDIIYFQKRLYRSLNVPVNRLEQESAVLSRSIH